MRKRHCYKEQMYRGLAHRNFELSTHFVRVLVVLDPISEVDP